MAGATAQTSISPTSWSGHGASVTGPSAFTTLPATTTPGASRVSVSQWDRAGSIAYNTAGSSYNSTNWTVGGSLSTAQSASSYVFFTVTNNAATELEITAVDISTQVSATGPGTMQLLYAIGSGSDVTYGSAYSGYGRVTTLTYSSSGTIHLCAGETIKFKLYGWGALGSSGTLRINNGTSITARFADAVGAIASGSSSCAGGITLSGRDTLGVSSYSYAWTGPSGYSSTSASPTTATAAGTYTLIVTDAWSCRDTATVAVSGGSGSGSFPLTITAITDTFCTGTGGTSITASGAGAGGSYTWSPGTGLSATTGGTVTANPSASVVYTITGTTSGGCTATDSLRITVYRSPSVIGGATSVCEGATITLTDSVSGGKWTSGTTTVASVDSTSGVVTGVTAGTVNITYTTPGGCFQWRSITVLPRPNAGVITGT
ncbi:MAG: hypothetical protein EBZ77_07275, partial [Chitinophagia bacterium]|nr:hypothetical protein [Chitinophagia bacterium]